MMKLQPFVDTDLSLDLSLANDGLYRLLTSTDSTFFFKSVIEFEQYYS